MPRFTALHRRLARAEDTVARRRPPAEDWGRELARRLMALAAHDEHVLGYAIEVEDSRLGIPVFPHDPWVTRIQHRYVEHALADDCTKHPSPAAEMCLRMWRSDTRPARPREGRQHTPPPGWPWLGL
jgi:hypothetical protein